MAQVKNGDTVKVHYTGKLNDGMVFDSSVNREPLQFKLGEKKVIPGFEDAVVGMSVGDKKTISIPADQAYGPHRKELVMEVEKSKLPADLDPKVGQQLQVRQEDDKTVKRKRTSVLISLPEPQNILLSAIRA